jgi:iron complex outermembrane receptor protein
MFDAFRVESISAYRGAQKWQYWSAEPVPAFVESAGWQEHEWEGSEELHIASNPSSKINWLGGAYFLRGSSAYTPFDIDGTDEFPVGRIQFAAKETTKSEAVFGQTTLPIAEATNATVGLRYTHETRGITGDTTLMFIPALGLPNLVTGLTDAQSTFSKITWRFALDHRFNDNLMTYISANRGFKSGVYNTIPPGGPTAKPVDPEVLDAYEIGAKTDWLDHKLRVNVAAFYYDYRDLQVTVFNTTSAIIENGARANVYGLDGDIAANLTENFTVTAGISAIQSKFLSYPEAQFLEPVAAAEGGGNNPVSASAAGNELPYSPKFTGDVAGNYVFPLTSGAKVAVHSNFYYSAKWYPGPDNILTQPAYHLLNGRVSWTLPGDKLTLAVWGKNLTNQQYYTYLSAGNNPGGYDEGIVAPPRTYGISAKYTF